MKLSSMQNDIHVFVDGDKEQDLIVLICRHGTKHVNETFFFTLEEAEELVFNLNKYIDLYTATKFPKEGGEKL